MSLSFLILAVRCLAIFMGLALLGLAVSGTWALTCWIAGHVQRRKEPQARRYQTDHDDHPHTPRGEQQ
ncbi:hypothetical protein N4G70_29190 [Streptomyces sp. ASQP_92]|uniref:hypothetical protein n=1 Tax=Streptomyces sp. ASQP_92 TaxID=2979116 RepID=UPI0021C16B3E|nr:hypothetical protein [Streptomyces sp. ASQP_92]MCT9092917.1 hypothetical protein [Streptomyces sp. ASQP_92]